MLYTIPIKVNSRFFQLLDFSNNMPDWGFNLQLTESQQTKNTTSLVVVAPNVPFLLLDTYIVHQYVKSSHNSNFGIVATGCYDIKLLNNASAVLVVHLSTMIVQILLHNDLLGNGKFYDHCSCVHFTPY
jgi:hypothetical protein